MGRALKRLARAGLVSSPGLSPSLKPGPRAGPGQAGLLGSAFNQFTLKNINFLQNVCKLNTWNIKKGTRDDENVAKKV